VDPETIQASFPTEKFQLVRGFPAAPKVEFITGMSGTIGYSLDEWNAGAVELAVGSGPGVRTYATTPTATTVEASPSPTAAGWTLASATNYVAGQLIEVPVSGVNYLTYIKAIATAAITVEPAL